MRFQQNIDFDENDRVLPKMAGHSTLNLDKPPPHPLWQDVNFVCCDVEHKEIADVTSDKATTEFGFAWLDSRDIRALSPLNLHSGLRPWFTRIQTHHIFSTNTEIGGRQNTTMEIPGCSTDFTMAPVLSSPNAMLNDTYPYRGIPFFFTYMSRRSQSLSSIHRLSGSEFLRC